MSEIPDLPAGIKLDIQDPEALKDPATLEMIQGLIEDLDKNPLQRCFPYPKQIAFLKSKVKTKVFLGGNRCLVADTLVRMADGSQKAISEIEPGERVFGLNEQGKAEPCEVLERICNGFQPVYEYTFARKKRTISVGATEDHLVRMRRSPRAESIRPIGEATSSSWKATLARGFEPENSVEGSSRFALLFGLLLGDGSFSDQGPGGRRATFHNTESELLDLCEEEAHSLGMGTARSHDRLTLNGQGAPRGWHLDLLERHGLNKKAHEKRLPPEAKRWSNEAIGRLLAGLFLTDGWVCADDASCGVGIQLTSRLMVEEIRDLLADRFGVHGSVTVKREYEAKGQRDGFTLRVASRPALRRFQAAVPLMGRKAAILKRGVDNKGKRENDSSHMSFAGKRYLGEQLVYDLRISHPSELFLLGNGMIVHNCGKSSTWVIYVLIQCLPKAAIPPHLLPFKIWNEPIRVRVVTPDYGRTFKSVMEIFEKWTPGSRLRGGSWDEGFRDKDKQIFFANGSFIEFLTLEQDVNKFGGAPRHLICFDEEPKGEKGEEIYRQCAMRLADFRGEEIFAFTPVHGLGWTFDELWEKRGEEIAPDVWKAENQILVQASIHDNPFIDPEGKAEALAKLPERVRAAYESGNFIHFQGLVYEMFDPELHVEDPPSPEQIKEWVQVDGVDPGQGTNANLFAAFERIEDGNDILHIYDELTLSGTGAVPEHAVPMIFGRRAAWGLPQHPKYRVIDPAVKSRDLGTGERLDAAYRRAGLKMIPAQNEREAGVFEVWRRMEHKDLEGNPRPLIKISTKCVNTLKEFGKYRLNPKEDGSFDVIKKNDHHMDAMRYIAMTHAPKPKVKGRPKKEAWVPGSAPTYRAPQKEYGPMGRFG